MKKHPSRLVVLGADDERLLPTPLVTVLLDLDEHGYKLVVARYGPAYLPERRDRAGIMREAQRRLEQAGKPWSKTDASERERMQDLVASDVRLFWSGHAFRLRIHNLVCKITPKL